jgi:hypothetical protein
LQVSDKTTFSENYLNLMGMSNVGYYLTSNFVILAVQLFSIVRTTKSRRLYLAQAAASMEERM